MAKDLAKLLAEGIGNLVLFAVMLVVALLVIGAIAFAASAVDLSAGP